MNNVNKTNEIECQFVDGVLAGSDIENASRELKAIAHPLRLQILCCIGKKEISVQDIVNHVGTSQSNISQHLSVLRAKGVVASKKVANRVFYHVKSSTVLQMMGIKNEVSK